MAYVCLSRGPPLGFSENMLRHSRREGFPGDPLSHLQFGLEKCRQNQPQFHQDRRDSLDDRVFPDGTGVAGLANIYMELGFTFGRLVRRIRWSVRICPVGSSRRAGSTACCGGVGSICYDTPQRQIKAFRRFWVPDQLVKKHHYQLLTSEVKELTFGSKVARIFGVDVSAKRYAVSKDYLGRIRRSYFDAGTEPSHRMYGWITY